MNTKIMRLVRKTDEPTLTQRQQKFLAEIQERQANAPHGEGTIEVPPTKKYLPVDEILDRSFKQIG